jgi:carboxymethylenebutenolidase
MGQDITLISSDGFKFGAYRCDPGGTTKGAIIVVQEIFGVNRHIRDVTERFANVGYTAIAPALFDRWHKDFDGGYNADDMSVGRDLKAKANAELDKVLADVEAARENVADAGKVGITGFCWGGFIAWMAACRLNVDASVAYYGGGIIDYNDEELKCPTIAHFGREDASIPMADVEVIEAGHPSAEIFVYEADHGFHCDQRGQFNPRAANIAGMRTIRLFDDILAG